MMYYIKVNKPTGYCSYIEAQNKNVLSDYVKLYKKEFSNCIEVGEIKDFRLVKTGEY